MKECISVLSVYYDFYNIQEHWKIPVEKSYLEQQQQISL